MKKIFNIILLLLCLMISAQAATPNNLKMLSTIESNFFGVDYSDNTENVRLERIEKVLYGSVQKGSIEERIKKISNDTGTVIKESKPKVSENKNPKTDTEEYIAEDSSVDYPIVDELEMKVFKTKHNKDSIYARLDRLEQAIFKTTSKDVLNARVEKLADKVLTPTQSPISKPEKSITQTYMDRSKYNQYSTNGIYSDDYLFAQIGAMEKIAFNNIYVHDSIAQRLNRLETKFFNKTFPQDSPNARVERIAAVNIAKNGSAIYDNNKAMRNFAAASQIGGIILMILAMIL